MQLACWEGDDEQIELEGRGEEPREMKTRWTGAVWRGEDQGGGLSVIGKFNIHIIEL